MRRFSATDIILASNSPRRQQFLKDIGLSFTVQTHQVEEIFSPELKKEEISNYLVQLKARPFKTLSDNQLIITADTIVWSNGACLGKPKNTQEAKQMLRQLSGQSHEVITSVAFTQKTQQTLINETTVVHFKPLTEEEIEYYIRQFKPFDKAGGYGIQEWIGIIGIDKIEGSYTNVVGLPVAQVLTTLEQICHE
ncbi:MAG: Maf family nucleotide pyrophosphatase [Flavobacteriaceae bacterium]